MREKSCHCPKPRKAIVERPDQKHVHINANKTWVIVLVFLMKHNIDI